MYQAGDVRLLTLGVRLTFTLPRALGPDNYPSVCDRAAEAPVFSKDLWESYENDEPSSSMLG